MIQRYPHIDVLRGIAILMVIAVHVKISLTLNIEELHSIFFMLFQYGQMGVQLFFVMSAYTLTLSMEKRHDSSEPLVYYFIRRIFRIAPLYYFGIFLYMIVVPLIEYFIIHQFKIDEQYTFMNIMVNIFFLNGIFESANNNIVPGGWSIGTEVLFYGLFPIFFFIVQKKNINVFFLLTIIFVFNLLIQITLKNYFNVEVSNGSFYYYSILNQLPVFFLGMILYIYEDNEKFKSFFNVYTFLIFTVFAMYFYKSHDSYSFGFVPLFSALSFLSLYYIVQESNLRKVQILAFIGKISYSMYILHFIVIHYLVKFFEPILLNIANTYFTLIILYILTIIVSFVLGIISEKFIEKNGIKYGNYLIANMEEKRCQKS